jgi:hypothetical protein
MYMAAALAAVLAGCKNDAAPTPLSKDTAQNASGAGTDPAPAAPETATPDVEPKEGEVLLRLNYPKGFKQEVGYLVETKSNATTGTVEVMVNFEVTGAAENAYTFTGSIAGIKMDTETQGRKIKYDSAKKLPANAAKEEQALDKGFKGVQGKPFTFMLDKKGNITNELHFTGQEDNNMLPLDLGTYQMQFPATPVAVGATWTTKTADKQMGGTKTNTYTVKEIKDDTVIIGVKSILPPPPMPGAKESVFNGTYTIDRATGMLLKGSLSGSIETLGGTLTMSFTGKGR